MKLSLDWLSEFVAFSEQDPQKIAEALTRSVAEVEEVEVQGKFLERCVVGKIVSLKKHPNADKLSLCDVQTDEGVKHVVCGGTNLREGMLVAFAHVGAKVKGHDGGIVELKKAKIRGEESEGMICAAEELDLDEMFSPKPEDGARAVIDIRIKDDVLTGSELREALGLTDIIFHIDNHAITHRPDLFSQIGFARECVAIGLGTWKKKPEIKAPRFGKGKPSFKFLLDEPSLMPRYCACFLEIDDVGETPEWMKRRLAAVGWRSLSLPIDITNYVATEVGVPLHSFDTDDIRGTIHMRISREGEHVVTLDEKDRILPAGALVLSDDEGIFDLLGIMGGLRSSTKSSTRRIYLHSASLDPVAIRRTILATGHRTDAATIFEKGVPHITAEQGFYRAVQLFLELVPGARVVSPMESHGENKMSAPIALPLERASRLLGRDISQKEATGILTALDFAVSVKGKGKGESAVLTVTPPLHRIGDIHGEADLIEEIARITGFASFSEELPNVSLHIPPRDDRRDRVRDALRREGFCETVQLSFVGKEFLEKAKMSFGDEGQTRLRTIENPLGEDMRFLRPSLLPALLDAAERNAKTEREHLRLFEVGHVFSFGKERSALCLVELHYDPQMKELPFLSLKAALSSAARGINLRLTFKRLASAALWMHPGRAAEIRLNGVVIGTVFELHPDVLAAFDLPPRSAAAELNLDLLFAGRSSTRLYQPPFAFPSVTYDVTVTLDPLTEAEPLLAKACGSHPFLRDITLVDLFEKEKRRHVTFRCIYNAGDRTLTEEEVKPIHEKVEEVLQQ